MMGARRTKGRSCPEERARQKKGCLFALAARAEDRGADPNMGRAKANRLLEILSDDGDLTQEFLKRPDADALLRLGSLRQFQQDYTANNCTSSASVGATCEIVL